MTYAYDGLDQLLREDNAWLNATIVYIYDAGGNILEKQEYAYTIGALGALIDTVSYAYGDNNWKDKLTSYDGNAITYDALGNPLTYDGYAYSWQKGRQLAGISGNNLTLSFKYNQDGLRTKKTVNGITTSFIWFGDTLMSQSDGANTLIFSDFGVKINGDNYYFIKNLQGDVIGLYDSDGNIVVNYVYDSWGKVISITGSLAATVGELNPIRYRGYYYDSETGLYYLQSRYYNPEWGRFLNADALFIAGDSLTGANMFAYCGNNPVMFSDPTGYESIVSFVYRAIDFMLDFMYGMNGREINKIIYDVPVYGQHLVLPNGLIFEESKLCWAYCQVMYEAFIDHRDNGTKFMNQFQADARAKELAIAKHGENNWNQAGKPDCNGGIIYGITTFDKLCEYLEGGPVYAGYNNKNPNLSGHAVIVIGYNKTRGLVYIIDPSGFGSFRFLTFEDFMTYNNMEFSYIGLPEIYL